MQQLYPALRVDLGRLAPVQRVIVSDAVELSVGLELGVWVGVRVTVVAVGVCVPVTVSVVVKDGEVDLG